jgi:hypothetical protein
VENSHFLQPDPEGGEVFEGDYKFKQLKKIDKENIFFRFLSTAIKLTRNHFKAKQTRPRI